MFGRKKALPLTDDEIRQLQRQIESAENLSSAEFKIILVKSGWLGLRHKALKLFKKYHLEKTARHNAVLIVVDYTNHDMVLVGDSAIDKRVGEPFRVELEEMLDDALKGGPLFDALASCIKILGCHLPIYFPVDPQSSDELSNELVFEE